MLKSKQPDYFLIAIIGLLLIIGLVFLNSASSVIGYKNFKDTFYYLKHQIIFGLIPGLFFFVFLYFFKIKYLKKISYLLFLLSFILIIAVFIPGIGMKYREAQRWLDLRFFSFQPIEFFKLCFIIFLASFFSQREKEINDFYKTFLPFLLFFIIIAIPIIFQPNISALIIIFLISLSIYFVAGGSLVYIFGLILLGGTSFLILIKIAPYRLSRILSFISPNVDPQGISYHLQQSLIAIGSGGVLGRGFGCSGQKYFYLPEVFGDSIFAIIAEEVGFIFTVLIVFLLFLLILRGLKIAKNSSDLFSKLAALGITSWLGFQTIINIGAMIGILPLTGVPLPLISYGSSALVANLAGLGILVNISKSTQTME